LVRLDCSITAESEITWKKVGTSKWRKKTWSHPALQGRAIMLIRCTPENYSEVIRRVNEAVNVRMKWPNGTKTVIHLHCRETGRSPLHRNETYRTTSISDNSCGCPYWNDDSKMLTSTPGDYRSPVEYWPWIFHTSSLSKNQTPYWSLIEDRSITFS
jgi:hypothetical protein